MKQKCNKCNERGYIQLTKYSNKSCECGWAIEQSLNKFKDVPLATLLEYANMRIVEKQKLLNNL